MKRAASADTVPGDKPTADDDSAASISLGLTLVMAMACGTSVANIYYNQPMLGVIGNSFPGQRGVAGFVPTTTQLGCAMGLLFLVPLGDPRFLKALRMMMRQLVS